MGPPLPLPLPLPLPRMPPPPLKLGMVRTVPPLPPQPLRMPPPLPRMVTVIMVPQPPLLLPHLLPHLLPPPQQATQVMLTPILMLTPKQPHQTPKKHKQPLLTLIVWSAP
jgi:hypothetical protein